jgi:hypothetical protein
MQPISGKKLRVSKVERKCCFFLILFWHFEFTMGLVQFKPPIAMRNYLPGGANIKVNVPNLVISLNLTSIFKWYVDWLQEHMPKSEMFKRDWIACS